MCVLFTTFMVVKPLLALLPSYADADVYVWIVFHDLRGSIWNVYNAYIKYHLMSLMFVSSLHDNIIQSKHTKKYSISNHDIRVVRPISIWYIIKYIFKDTKLNNLIESIILKFQIESIEFGFYIHLNII